MLNKNILSLVICFLITSSLLGQSQEEVAWKKSLEEGIKKSKKMNENVIEILAENYPNKNLTHEQVLAHRDKLFEAYYKAKETKRLQIGTTPYNYYHTHIHPEKLDELRNIGIKYLFNDYVNSKLSYKDYVLFGEVVVIGTVRKFVYHPEATKLYHTSVIVDVDEYLRDDFGMTEGTGNKIIVKLQSGPLEGGKWIATSNDEDFRIGQQYLLYLSRYGYLSMLLDRFESSKNLAVQANEFVVPTIDTYPIHDSTIEVNGENLSIEEAKAGIRQVVDVLDVENFFSYSIKEE